MNVLVTGGAGYIGSRTCLELLNKGSSYSVLDMVKTFREVNDVALPYEIVARRPGDIATCYADPAKSAEVLARRPRRPWRICAGTPGTGRKIIPTATKADRSTRYEKVASFQIDSQVL